MLTVDPAIRAQSTSRQFLSLRTTRASLAKALCIQYMSEWTNTNPNKFLFRTLILVFRAIARHSLQAVLYHLLPCRRRHSLQAVLYHLLPCRRRHSLQAVLYHLHPCRCPALPKAPNIGALPPASIQASRWRWDNMRTYWDWYPKEQESYRNIQYFNGITPPQVMT
jgi:hypothetical protein